MFKSAIVKMTAMYLSILVIICLFFSANWFAIAQRELDRGTRQQDEWLQVNPRALGPNLMREFVRVRGEQLERSKQAVLLRIFLSDLGIIILGAAGSYYLARKTLRPIEEAHEAQVRFTADASHELRTPLAVIKTETEVTLRDPKLTKGEATRQLESNLEEVTRLQALTHSLLLLARDEKENPINISSVSLTETVQSSIEHVQTSAKLQNIKLEKQLELKKVIADPEILASILGILLDNAIKYSAKGGMVTVSSKVVDKKRGRLSVSDKGIGIPANQQQRIFERFYRVDQSRSKQKVEGHGLGLSIAQDLAKRMNANITVESREGSGSTFSIVLPRQS